MGILVMVGQLILALSILVFVHELGHFLAAKAFKTRVEKFYLFFDFLFPIPTILNFALFKFKRGETEYGLGWFPMGGYVQIAGMVDETQDASKLSAEPQPWEFRAKPAWQRLIIMIGGIVMNIITGFVIFAYYLGAFEQSYLPMSEVNKEGIYAYKTAQDIGLQTGDKIVAINGSTPERFRDLKSMGVILGGTITVDRNGKQQEVQVPSDFYKRLREDFVAPMRENVYVDQLPGETNARKAGLQANDQITSVDSTTINRFGDLQMALCQKSGSTAQIGIIRNGQAQTLTAQVDANGKIGFAPRFSYPYPENQYTASDIVRYSLKEGYEVTMTQILSLGMLFTGKVKATESVSSPIGIAKMYGDTWDWARFWRLTGLISFVLAIMNLLPIPALDGGHIVFLLVEMITRRKLPDAFMEKAQSVGMVLLLSLMVFAFGNDIYKSLFKPAAPTEQVAAPAKPC